MATEKRRFYNTGDAKGFTKAAFYAAVKAMADGEEVDDATVALVGAAAQYELDGIAAKAPASTGERKDPMQSDYAVALREAIVPLLSDKPQTAEDLVNAATAKGSLAPSGKEWAKPWVSRVLSALAEEGTVTKTSVIVTKTDSKGLNAQKEAAAFTK